MKLLPYIRLFTVARNKGSKYCPYIISITMAPDDKRFVPHSSHNSSSTLVSTYTYTNLKLTTILKPHNPLRSVSNQEGLSSLLPVSTETPVQYRKPQKILLTPPSEPAVLRQRGVQVKTERDRDTRGKKTVSRESQCPSRKVSPVMYIEPKWRRGECGVATDNNRQRLGERPR